MRDTMSFRIDREKAEKLKKRAGKLGITTCVYMEEIIREYLSRTIMKRNDQGEIVLIRNENIERRSPIWPL